MNRWLMIRNLELTLDLISRSICFCLRNGQEETIKVNGRNRQVYEI